MRQGKTHYRVMIEQTGFAKDFDCLGDACDYAKKLARDTGFEVVVCAVDSSASRAPDMYFPVFLYDGDSGFAYVYGAEEE